MPKVVVTLEVADSGATRNINQFGRSVQDAFSQVKAGDPALQSATLRVQQLTGAKTQATSAVMAFTAQLSAVPGPIGQMASQVQALTGFLAGPAGLAAGAVAVGAAVVGLANSFGGAIERLDDLSALSGLTVASIQTLEQAAIEAGKSPEDLVQGFGKLNRAIQDVLLGNENASKSFDAIGLNMKALVTSGASSEQILEAVAKALHGISDPVRRAAAETDIFGTRSRALQTTLDKIATQGLPAMTEEMRKVGVVTSESANKMARQWDSAVDEMGRKFTGFTNQLKADAVEIALGLKGITDALTAVVGLDFEVSWIVKLYEWVNRLINPMARLVELMKQAADFIKSFRDVSGDMRGRGITGETAPGPRDIPPSERETREAQRRIEEMSKAWGAYADSIFEETERAQRAIAEASDREARRVAALSALEAQTVLEEVFRKAVEIQERLRDRPILPLDESVEELRDWNDQAHLAAQITQNLGGDTFTRFAKVVRDVRDGMADANKELSLFGEGERQAAKMVQLFEELGQGVGGVDEHLAAGVVHMKRDLTDLERATRRAGHAFEAAFSDAIFAAMENRFEHLDDIFVELVRSWEKMLADFIVRDLGKLFEVGGAQGTSAIGRLFTEITRELERTGGDLITSFQNLSAESAATAQALAAAAGVILGSIAGGGGQNANVGATVGAGVGGIAGNALGGQGGAALGSLLGGLVGGWIGGMFDDEEFDAFGGRLRDSVSGAFKEGVLMAVESGDVDKAWAHIQETLGTAIEEAVIDAFVQSTLIRDAIAPLIDALNKAANESMTEGGIFDPAKFTGAIGPAMDAFRGKMQALEPVFRVFVDIFQNEIRPAIKGTGTAVDQVHQSTERTVQATQNLRTATEDVTTSMETLRDTVGTDPTAGADTVTGGLSAANAQLTAFSEGLTGIHEQAAGIGTEFENWKTHHHMLLEIERKIVGDPAPGSEGGSADPSGGGASGPGFAHGGWMRHTGPAFLHADEFVVRAPMARRHARDVEAINAGLGGSVVGLSAEERMLWREEIEAIRENTREIRRRRQAGVGAPI